MAKSHEREALAAALKREQRGEAWYMNAADSTENPIAKATFATLARRQRRCVEAIQKIQQTFRRNSVSPGRRVTLPSLRPASAVIEALFHRTETSGGRKPEPSTRALFKSYSWALGFEERGAAMYTHKSGVLKERFIADLFDFLRRKKGEHYRILDGTLTYLHSPETFFEEMAKSPFSQKGE
jgi:rubrerythrin